jgi:steroid 5-alpha reductase family enzyme
LKLAFIILIYASSWYIISLFSRRNDVADIAWGLGYIVLCIYCYLYVSVQPTAVVVYALVTLWGLRLSIYIGLRNGKKTEDFRYKQWREEWGKTFYWRSYLQVYLLQGLFLLIISCPIILAAYSEPSPLHWSAYVAVGFWIIGFYWQSVGDYQMTQFRKNRLDKNEVMNKGLWKYSRHPNYFGEILMWWAVFVIVLPMEYGIYAMLSPLMITWLLVFVSGVPMLERKYKGNPRYDEYKQNTPALIPRFW